MLDPVIVASFMDEFQKIAAAEALTKEAVGGNILGAGSMPLRVGAGGSIGTDPRFEGLQAHMHDPNALVNNISARSKAAPIGLAPHMTKAPGAAAAAASKLAPAAKPGMLAGLAAKMRGAFSGLRPAFG